MLAHPAGPLSNGFWVFGLSVERANPQTLKLPLWRVVARCLTRFRRKRANPKILNLPLWRDFCPPA